MSQVAGSRYQVSGSTIPELQWIHSTLQHKTTRTPTKSPPTHLHRINFRPSPPHCYSKTSKAPLQDSPMPQGYSVHQSLSILQEIDYRGTGGSLCYSEQDYSTPLQLLTATIHTAHSAILQEVQELLEILRHWRVLFGRFMGRRRSYCLYSRSGALQQRHSHISNNVPVMIAKNQ